MNIGEANAVNVVVHALAGLPNAHTGELPTAEQQQDAVDLLLRGAYKALSAGLQPGHVTIGGGS